MTFLSCTSCGFVFREPLPTRDTLERYYQNVWEKIEENASHGQKALATADRFLRQLSKYSKPGRFLDVGCGPGFYLMAASQKGWDSYGVDISPSFVKREQGIKIFKGTLQEARFPSGFFDACLMCHTLSHLLNPIEALREVRRVLRPGGIFIVAIPNFLRLGVSRLEGQWESLLKERHLYLFSPETARRMVQTAGFKLLRLDTHAEVLTRDQAERFHLPLHRGPGRLLVRFGSGPKEFLRRVFGKIFPGPTFVLWSKREGAL